MLEGKVQVEAKLSPEEQTKRDGMKDERDIGSVDTEEPAAEVKTKMERRAH